MEITRLSVAEVVASPRTFADGLDGPEATRRLQEFGPNHIEEAQGKPLWLRFLEQFTHLFALILWVAVALEIALLVAIVYTPLGHAAFGTAPLS